MNISILTTTLGREYYLIKLIESINKRSNWQKHDLIHYIVYQGTPSQEFVSYIKTVPYKIILKVNSQAPLSIGEVMNQFKEVCKTDLFWKLDDDALLCSDEALDHIEELYKIKPEAVFSPYPVGLINNPGGVLSKNHSVEYSSKTNTYYTLRRVHHVGGFARIMPINFLKHITCTNTHSEDTECSQWCNNNNKLMYYLENTLIVEHQESTLGQHKRYGENYFKGRF